MKKLTRPLLHKSELAYLRRRRNDASIKLAAGTLNIDNHWASSRQTVSLANIIEKLNNAANIRQRCMYCLDSHGSDVDHFYPKSKYKLSAYSWRNFVINCTACGRLKGSNFPMVGRRPLLINPWVDDPWKHLVFDPSTGNLSARFDLWTRERRCVMR